MILSWLAIPIVGYLLGALPTGYLMAKLWRGIDIRKVGSGRTGGTNVLRAAGPVPAALTVLGDTLKAYLAVWAAKQILGVPLASALAGIAAVLGHNHSIFLGGKGGAGSMCTVGVLAAFSLPIAAIAGGLSLLPLLITRFASLGSLTLAVLAPLLLLGDALLGKLPLEYSLGALVIGAMTIYQLRPNIRRLLAGTERRIGEKTAS